ncbi:lytic transglycosylase domain-containing protein [Mesorhizobium sp. CA4]|nr:lytic transglycosylase domain-containing protein [Mesorhizobium sp. CA4]MBZ9818732.1 lytic transglycosylase domain-containing protein [Mesorhizobium sp. CA4]
MQRFVKMTLLLACTLIAAGPALADPPQSKSAAKRLINRVCDLIETQAQQNGLPKDFFARLIWKESRFDPNAVSPVGAEGIAQFMPGTAKMRGLANSFDIGQAIPASAKYLAEMKASYGNLGLAAAAYNAGENRVSRWLASGGFLPMETESYVFDIMGEPVDKFADKSYAGTVQPLDPKMSFAVACRRLPVIMSRTVAMASINVKPWGVQVAGNFRRSAAIGQWLRVKSRFPALLASRDPVVSRVRTPIGRRGIYAVRIGADSRGEANGICTRLQSVGGACVVLRNR